MFDWSAYSSKKESSETKRNKEFVERTIHEAHNSFMQFMPKEFGFQTIPGSIEYVCLTKSRGAAYYRAGERNKEGHYCNENRIEIGLDRDCREIGKLIQEVRYDVAHEGGHHLHFKINPAIIPNQVWRVDCSLIFPLDNWYVRELVAEFAAIRWFDIADLELPRKFLDSFHGRVEPVICLYKKDKNLLKRLANMDELNIPDEFKRTIDEMSEADLKHSLETE